MDILFKPRVEATELMAQNCMDISQTNQESKRTQNRIQVTCIIIVCNSYFLFQFYFTPKLETGQKLEGGRAGAFLFWPTSFGETLPIPGAEKMMTPQNSLHNLS